MDTTPKINHMVHFAGVELFLGTLAKFMEYVGSLKLKCHLLPASIITNRGTQLLCMDDSHRKHCIVLSITSYCYVCSEVFDTQLEGLPLATGAGNSAVCDVCTSKGGGNQPAVSYCTHCTKKYCTKHLQVPVMYCYSCR